MQVPLKPAIYSAHTWTGTISMQKLQQRTEPALARFTFNEAGQANILLNLGHGLTNESGALVKMVSDTEIEGYKLLGTFCYNEDAVFPVYFVVEFSKPAKSPRLLEKAAHSSRIPPPMVKHQRTI
jgi:hypothetical protein